MNLDFSSSGGGGAPASLGYHCPKASLKNAALPPLRLHEQIRYLKSNEKPLCDTSEVSKRFNPARHNVETTREIHLDPDLQGCGHLHKDPDLQSCGHLNKKPNPQDIDQIDMDLPRTARGDPLVCPHMDLIRAILLRHAAEDPQLGYCQGMNLVAAGFVAASESQIEALQRFSSFVRRVRGLWLPGFPLLQHALAQFSLIVQTRSWYTHMKARHVDPSMYLPQALMTMLTMWLPFATVVVCIDVLEHEGLAGLLAASIAVLDHLGPRIQSLRTMGEILEFVKCLRHCAPNPDELVFGIRKILPEVVAGSAQADQKALKKQPDVCVEFKAKQAADEASQSSSVSISQVLTRTLVEIEAVGQRALAWAETGVGMATTFPSFTECAEKGVPAVGIRTIVTL